MYTNRTPDVYQVDMALWLDNVQSKAQIFLKDSKDIINVPKTFRRGKWIWYRLVRITVEDF